MRRALAAALAVALMPGCLSVQMAGTRDSGGEGGGIALEVYENDRAHRQAELGPTGVVSELERLEDRDWVPVFRSLEPAWVVAGLPAGRYRVRFPARLDEAGNVVRLDGGAQTVNVRDGRVTEVHAILEHIPPLLVAVGVVTVVVAAVLISKYLSEHDLPDPPVPPPGVVEAIFVLRLDLPVAAGWRPVSDREAPLMTSHFPAEGALVAARRPKIVLAFSEALAPEEVEARGVSVLGERSGLVEGNLSYDAAYWWLVWEPSRDLDPGDVLHVTVAADAVEDLAGNELAGPVTFTFATAR